MSNIEDVYPLTPMQEGILFHSLEMPEYEIYTVQLCCALRDLDLERWKQAWQLVIGRHAPLRTAFAWKSQRQPLQVIGRRTAMPWEYHDWRALPEAGLPEREEEFLLADRRRGFDLSRAPLMRATIMQLDERTYRFCWSYHHVILDAWSGSKVLAEVRRAYDELFERASVVLPQGPPFKNYIAWLQTRDRADAERFWRGMLEGFAPAATMGTDRVGGVADADGVRYDECFVELANAETAELNGGARRHGLTLNTLIQGAWALMLARCTGSDDVLFGSTVSGRPADLPRVEEMVGLFINTLPVRIEIDPADTVLDWLRKLQSQHVEIREYEFSSLVDVHGWSSVPRGRPLFESILIVENLPADLSVLSTRSRLKIDDMRAHWRTSYPLSLMCVPGRRLKLQLVYDSGRFGSDRMEHMLADLHVLLVHLLADPRRSLADLLAMAGDGGLSPTLHGATDPLLPAGFVHDRFLEQAGRRPASVAVRFGHECITYGELEQWSGRIAERLCREGVGPEVCVALLAERSPEMVAALLGIMRAGGAYLPLDPAHPTERLDLILADSRADLVLAQRPLAGRLPMYRGRMLFVDETADPVRTEPASAAASARQTQLLPANLAYVIYTSGSTGRPKGVMVEHRSLSNLIGSMERTPGMAADDRLLAVTTLAFDIAALELFLPLVVGGELILASEEAAANPSALMEMMDRTDATIMQATPATWRMLIDAGWEGRSTMTVLCGGERLPADLARRLHRCCGSLWNMYGPTETTIWSSIARIGADDVRIALGAPIAHTTIRLLDAHLRPVPLGAVGEIHIGGRGLARGYCGHPDRTAEQFVPAPDHAEAGERLYRTGDMARMHADGTVEFLGRRDQQIKIRGFRIEAGEIEALLAKHPSIAEAVVLPVGDLSPSSAEGLIACVVPVAGAAVAANQLRNHLKRGLPSYMIPSAFVVMESLPVTPNG
ncbi:MAG TPA: amino acid adenylation domain-containing protein [Candidatus Kapabacteria bacterium]|nr:amino acid adenylation domain-containing protein [Candidatus Kapabacteria bacterium]